MEIETPTNPVDGATDFVSFEDEATEATATEVETQESDEPQLDDDGNAIDLNAAPDTFEVKGADGKTYSVPSSDWIETPTIRSEPKGSSKLNAHWRLSSRRRTESDRPSSRRA